MGSDICLPVARYSHATGLRADNTVAWNHISSSNLFIVVRGTDKDIKDEKLVLRVVQANDVLESLDVGEYIGSAVKVRHASRSKGEVLRVEQLPIFGITKDTIVALRYTLRDGQSRRLQMRMHSTADCRQVVYAFENRGMEFMEQRPGTARPSTARPLTTTSRFVAPHSSSPYFDAPEHPPRHPFTAHVVEAGSSSQVRPISPERVHRHNEVPLQHEHQPSQAMPPPKVFSRDESSAPREVAPTRPSTSQMYRLHGTQENARPYDTQINAQQAERSGESSSSTFAATDPITHLSEEPHLGARDEKTAQGARPSTSSSLVFPETLEHEIPPRRELPFPRPDSRRSGSDTAGSRPRSALTLPPLPKQRLSTSSANDTRIAIAQRPISSARPQTSSPLKRALDQTDDSAEGIRRPNTASPSKPTSPIQMSSPQAPAKKPSRMEELLDARRRSLEKSSPSKATRQDSLADAPGEDGDAFLGVDHLPPERPILGQANMPPVQHASTAQEETANAYAAVSSATQRDDSLARYANQSSQDRQAALDEFMVRNLENPDFTKLCRDVENCWRRIALGL